MTKQRRQAPSANGTAHSRPTQTDPIALNQLVQAVNGLTTNLSTLSRGAQRGLDDPRRSIEDECGYPPLDSPVAIDLYRQLFDRNGIANRAVQMMPKECFQKPFLCYETEDSTDVTPFEQGLDNMSMSLASYGQSWEQGAGLERLSAYLQRADVRSRIGSFGIILTLIDDGKNLQEPVDGMVNVSWQQTPVKKLVVNSKGHIEERVVSVRRHSPVYQPVMEDSPLTNAELQFVRNLPPKKTWVRYDHASKQHVYKNAPQPPLSRQERLTVNSWVQNAKARPKPPGQPVGVPHQPPTKEVAIAHGALPQSTTRALPQSLAGAVPIAPPLPQRSGRPSLPQQPPIGAKPAAPHSPPTQGNPNGPPPGTPVDKAKAQPGPLEPNALLPVPYQPGQFNPLDPKTHQGALPNGEPPTGGANGKPVPTVPGTGGGPAPNLGAGPDAVRQPPGVRAAGGRPAADTPFGTSPVTGAGGDGYDRSPASLTDGTDRQYGTSTSDQSAGFGMPPPSGYGRLSGTDQQYFGVQLGPSELPSAGANPPAQPRRLIGLRVYDESLVQVVRYEWNINNPRFGMPVMYRVTLNDPRHSHSGIGLPMATVFVHWSRLIHVADIHANSSNSEIFAEPVLQPVLENILDVRKVPGAAAEGYWQAGVPTWVFSTHPQLGGDVLVNKAEMQDEIELVMNALQKFMLGIGGTWDLKGPQVTDPTPFVECLINLVCIQLGCPIRVFKGSERGELASSQDDSSWNDRIRNRQLTYLTPCLICPFIDRMISLGVLPVPQGYYIEWPDLDSMTDSQKATVFSTRITAYAAAEQGGVYNTIPKRDVMTKLDFFTEEEADAMEMEAQRQAEEDMAAAQQLAEDQGFAPTPPEGFVDPDQQDREHEQAMAVAKNPSHGVPPGGGGKAPPFGGPPKAGGGPPGKGGGPPGAPPGGGGAPPPGAGRPPKPPAGPPPSPGAKPPPSSFGGKAPVQPATGAPAQPVVPTKPVPPVKPKKPPLLNRLTSWFTGNRYQETELDSLIQQAKIGTHGPSEAVARAASYTEDELYSSLNRAGIDGIHPEDSKAGMLQRLHDHLTQNFDQDQPRNPDGTWGSGVGGGHPAESQEGGGLTRLPETEEEVIALAESARDEIVGDAQAEPGDCITATATLAGIHPDVETWKGTYPGNWPEGGTHYISKVGDWFIDVTSDQFDGPPVRVFREGSDEHEELYSSFRPTNEEVVRPTVVPKAVVADLARKERGHGMTRPTRNSRGSTRNSEGNNFFSECERDEHGWCMPEGGSHADAIKSAVGHGSRYKSNTHTLEQHRASDEGAADKIVDRVSGLSKADLHTVLKEGGIEGIKPSMSKPALLQRLHQRVTAGFRARERVQV